MIIADKRYEAVAIEALSLSCPQRRDLVGRLLQSLQEDVCEDDAENLKIAEERLQRIRSGADSTISHQEFRDNIRAKHGL